MAPSHQTAPPFDAAVLFADKGAASVFGERLRGAWTATQGALRCVGGRVGECWVMSVVAGKPPVDYEAVVSAVIAAHRPARLVAAGFATATTPPDADDRVRAVRRAVGRDGQSIDLQEPASRMAHVDVFAQLGDDPASAVECEWACDLGTACARLGVPVTVLLALAPDPQRVSDPGLRSLARQESLAGRLGAAVGAVWRRPAAAGDLWNRQTRRWESQEQLADALVRELTPGDVGRPPVDLPETERRR